MTRLLARGRSIAAFGLLLAAALGLLAATQPWGTARLIDGRVLTAPGQQIAGGLTIMALACAVLALVLPIAGRLWRYILGVLALALGAGLVAHVLSTSAGTLAVLDALIADATGIAGSGQSAEVAEIVADGWSAAGVAAGALTIVVALWVLISAHAWPAKAKRTARYERTGSGLAWDVMDDGEDPTR